MKLASNEFDPLHILAIRKVQTLPKRKFGEKHALPRSTAKESRNTLHRDAVLLFSVVVASDHNDCPSTGLVGERACRNFSTAPTTPPDSAMDSPQSKQTASALHTQDAAHPSDIQSTKTACPTHPTTSIHLFTDFAAGRKTVGVCLRGRERKTIHRMGVALSKPP